MEFIGLILSLLSTAIIYMLFPAIKLVLNHGQFEKQTARKIALWNSIILGGLFCILTPLLGGVWNAAPAILYYWINKALLTKKKTLDNLMMTISLIATKMTILTNSFC